MPFKPLVPFPNPSAGTSFVFPEREKGFGEKLVDDVSNMSLKQLAGIPFSVPLQAGAGALKGASFGLLDFTDDATDAIGDFGLPDTVTSSLNIAGEIGGSFVPFIGASKVAHRLFQGLGLAADLARGATTFGAPELARQALTQEFSPQAGARSLATGAAFALPRPRIILAPVVAGTELLFGAEPLEAAAAGLFAGIFGSMSKRPQPLVEEVASLRPGKKLSEFQKTFQEGGEIGGVPRDGSPTHFTAGPKLAQDFSPPMPRGPKNVLREVMDDISLGRSGPLSRADRTALESVAPSFGQTGQRQLFPAQGGGKSQVEAMRDAAREVGGGTHSVQSQVREIGVKRVQRFSGRQVTPARELVEDIRANGIKTPIEIGVSPAGERIIFEGEHRLAAAAELGLAKVPTREVAIGPELTATLKRIGPEQGGKAANILRLAKQVEHEAATKSSSQLSLETDNLVRTVGPQDQRTWVARAAHSEKLGEYNPAGAPITNEPAKILQLRGMNMITQDTSNPYTIKAEFLKLQATLHGGPPAAQLKAIQMDDIVTEANQLTAAARGLDNELAPGKIAELTVKMEAALASTEVGIQSEAEAVHYMRRLMGQHTTAEGVLAIAKDPPPEVLKAFPNGLKRFQQMAEDRAQVIKYVSEETGASQFLAKNRKPVPGLDELRAKASDHGLQVRVRTRPAERLVGINAGQPTKAGGQVTEVVQMTLGGQNVRRFRDVKQADAWVTALETGKVDPTDIHELRALGYSRSIDVIYNGNGTVTLTNTMSGETFQGAKNLKEATEVVRQAPNIAAASREIGPRVPVGTHPPLSGTGSIGSIAAEQPPPADICGMPAYRRFNDNPRPAGASAQVGRRVDAAVRRGRRGGEGGI